MTNFNGKLKHRQQIDTICIYIVVGLFNPHEYKRKYYNFVDFTHLENNE